VRPVAQSKTTEITLCLLAATPVPMSNWNSMKEITNWEAGTVELWNREE
jgi:hypothetical protein